MQNKISRLKLVKLSLLFLFVGILVVSCKKEEDNYTIIPIRDRALQQIADEDSIVKYLTNHYYNKSKFQGNTNVSISDLIISDLPTDIKISSDADSLLINAVEFIPIKYLGVDYKIYYLNLQQGGGKSPTFADNALFIYEGFTLDNPNPFSGIATPDILDLVNLPVLAWSQLLPLFKTAQSITENKDGTLTYVNQGVGAMFVPSGLAYFSGPVSGIPLYSPLVFKFELLQFSQNDHDGDGIPSYLEDLNNDKLFNLASDDTDTDGKPNYSDSDDDGDGVLTEYEIDKTKTGIEAFMMGSNGKYKHLDPTQ